MASTSSQYSDATTWLPPWDGAEYAANTAHHRAYDAWFLEGLPLQRTDRVLDIGCGAGDFTATVAGLVPDGQVVGIDPQPSMLSEARQRAAANQVFVEGSAQGLREAVGALAPFDVAYSRSVLHWVPAVDHPGVLAGAHALLRPGGALRIECGGGDNVARVVEFLDDVAAALGDARAPWNFAMAGAYLDLLLASGFDPAAGWCRNVAQRRAFDRDSVLGWLTSQCLHAYEAGLPADMHAAFREAVEARVDELRRPDGSYDVTFVRLDVLAFRV
jgi:trans-aconitate methyltransferase